MKLKRIASVLMVLAILTALFSGVTTVSAAGSNTYTRGTVCTELSSQAKSYYNGSYSYEIMSELSGGNTDCLETTSSALYKRLQTLMYSTQTDDVSYKSLTSYWPRTDNNILFYSNVKGSSYNREHVWPKSRASFYQQGGGADLHHLRPADFDVNSARLNYTMGYVNGVISGCSTYQYRGQTVLWISAGRDRVEVLDSVKGDVARILLYVYVRWGQPNLFSNVSSDNLPKMDPDDNKNNGKAVIESLDTLLKWCELDPVDTWEMKRNDCIEDIQGNRNVFIDYPEYAWLLFDQNIPNDMQTPSGEAKNSGPACTLTAEANSAAYGTVTVSGKKVTAVPSVGYEIDSAAPYTLTPADAATVTRSGNVFTVSKMTSDCKLTINFKARTAATISYFVPTGVTVSGTTSCYVGDTVRLATVSGTPNDAANTYTFVGWAADAIDGKTAVKPTTSAAGSNFTVKTAANSFYGVYSVVEDGATYYLTNTCDHAETESVRVEPTCTKAGAVRTVCKSCGAVISEKPIAALGHDYQETVVAPTCTAKGYTEYTCSRCGDSFKKKFTAMVDHKYENGKCTVCGAADPSYKPEEDKTPKYGDFSDLKTGRWYEAGVTFALKNGLMNGVGGGKFDPDGSVTRGMLVTILYRVEKTPSVEGMKNPFTDVKSGAWYTDAIVWAADQGIVNGTSATTFAPDAFITREQIATILYRYAKAEKTEKDLSAYPDAGTVSGYAVDAMRWAVAEGLINGKDGRLAPQENATRAQIATILERYLSK